MESGTIWAMAGLAIGVIGIIVAIVEARKYRGPLLCYQYHGSNLIQSYDAIFPETIEVSFGGEKVPNLTHSQIVVWNRGRSPIRGGDVSENDPLALKFGEQGEVLQAEVVKISKESNLFKIEYQPRSPAIKLAFDFLDRNDGALLSVWHTSTNVEPTLDGTLIQGDAGPFKLGKFAGPRPNVAASKSDENSLEQSLFRASKIIRERPQLIAGSTIVMGMVLILGSAGALLRDGFDVAVPFLPERIDPVEAEPYTLFVPLVIGLIYTAMGIILWQLIRRRFPKTLLPDDYAKDE